MRRHLSETESPVAAALLADWPRSVRRFRAIIARDYARVRAATKLAQQEGRDVDEAVMEAAR